MRPPEIESSTRQQREQYIYDNFYCRADCDNCGLCKVYRGQPLEIVYADYIEGKRTFNEIAAEYKGRR